jgi:hypothetical protein
MNESSKIHDLELPAHFARRFSVHLYYVSHRLLLLRAGKTSENATRIEILFQDVAWMAISTWFDGLRISAATTAAHSAGH